MAGQKPGPVCSTRVGDDWIDLGTSCRARTGKPGGTGLAEDLIFAEFAALSPFRAKFDSDHVYSKAPEAARKRTIDLQIIGDDYSRSSEISIGNEAYLKQLIKIASGGNKEVSV